MRNKLNIYHFLSTKNLVILHLILTLFYWFQICIFGQRYNNFLIYRFSFYHLVAHNGLYALYPAEYFDQFLYSPVFATLMAPFAWFPVKLGLLVWLFFSVIVVLSGLLKLNLKNEHLAFVLCLLIFDLGTNIQHAQANIIVLGGMIWCFYFLETLQNVKFSILCALLFWLKVFPAALILLILFYNKTIRTFLWFLLFIVIWGLIPLIFISPHELAVTYQSWWLVIGGTAILEHFSIMGFFSYKLGLNYPEWVFMFTGVVLCAGYYFSLLSKKQPLDYNERISFFSFLLIWVVVFNRAAESPTFLLVSAAIYLWIGFHSNSKFARTLFIISFLSMTLFPSDLFPVSINNLFKMMELKPIVGSVFLIVIPLYYLRSLIQKQEIK